MPQHSEKPPVIDLEAARLARLWPTIYGAPTRDFERLCDAVVAGKVRSNLVSHWHCKHYNRKNNHCSVKNARVYSAVERCVKVEFIRG